MSGLMPDIPISHQMIIPLVLAPMPAIPVPHWEMPFFWALLPGETTQAHTTLLPALIQVLPILLARATLFWVILRGIKIVLDPILSLVRMLVITIVAAPVIVFLAIDPVIRTQLTAITLLSAHIPVTPATEELLILFSVITPVTQQLPVAGMSC